MVYRPNVEQNLCFVLLPLRFPFLGYFEKIIKPAASQVGLQAVKADDIYGTRAVIKDIWEHIWKARAVIAIVTDKNPNVNYELGLCHALGVPTVLISEKAEDVPFDYRHRRYIPYQTPEAGWEQKLREDITKTLKAVLSSPISEDELIWPYSTVDPHEGGRVGTLVGAEEARTHVVQGADQVGASVAPAFGPGGKRVSVMVQEIGHQMAFSRGARIAQRMRSGDPLRQHGIEQMARLADEVLRATGDGSKTSIFLSASILREGDAALRAGHNSKAMLAGMERAVETAIAHLMTAAEPVTGKEIRNIALSACAFDKTTADLVSVALERAGSDGIVQVVAGSAAQPQLDIQEGMHFDRGYLSPMFVNDERQECILEDCYILLYERPVSSMKDMLPIMEQIAKAAKPLLVISQDVAGEALATLVVNKLRGTLLSAAVKAPASGDQRTAMMEDIAILTGGRAFLQETAPPLDHVKLSNLGKAQKVIVTKDSTTIMGGAGVAKDVADRIKQLKIQLSQTIVPIETERLRERLARLGGAIVVVRTSAGTDEDIADARYKLESALNACRSAIENGYVAGGGVSLCNAKRLVEKLVPKDDSEKAGITAVSAALVSPLRQLLENSGVDQAEKIIDEIANAGDGQIGFNVETKRIEDISTAGVMDSAKALSVALHLALAYASGILKTGAWATGS